MFVFVWFLVANWKFPVNIHKKGNPTLGEEMPDVNFSVYVFHLNSGEDYQSEEVLCQAKHWSCGTSFYL